MNIVNVGLSPSTTHYIRPSGTTYGLNDGSSYANAWNSFASAVTAMQSNVIKNRDIIYLAEAGTYTISAYQEITKSVTIRGVDKYTTIIQAHEDNAEYGIGYGMLFLENVSNVIIENLTIDGRLDDVIDWTYDYGIDSDYTERSSGIWLGTGTTDCEVKNVIVKNQTRNGITLCGNNNAIRGITVDNTASGNVTFGNAGVNGGVGIYSNLSAYNLTLSRSIGKDCLEIKDGITNVLVDGVDITNDDRGAAFRILDHGASGGSSSGVVIRNMHIVGCNDRGINFFVNTVYGGNTISDVQFYDCSVTRSSNTAFNPGIAIGGNVSNVTFTRVVITGQEGVKVERTASAVLHVDPSDITFVDCDIISNQDVINNNGIEVKTDNGDITFEGIYVEGFNGHGIHVEDTDDVIFRESSTRVNRVYNCGVFEEEGSGIYIVGSGSGLELRDCILGNETSQDQGCSYGLTVPSTYDDTIISDVTSVNIGVATFNGDFAGTNFVVSSSDDMPAFPNVLTGYTHIQTAVARAAELGIKIDSAHLTAFDDFFDDLGSDLRGRLKTLYFCYGGDAKISLLNFANPSTYLKSFVRSANGYYFPYNRAVGIRSQGQGYINNNYKTDEYSGIETDLTTLFYLPTDRTEDFTGLPTGAATGSGNFMEMQPLNGPDRRRHYASGWSSFTNTNSRGLYVHTYDGTNDVIYKDGVKTSNATTPSAPSISANFFTLTSNRTTSNNGNTPTGYLEDADLSVIGLLDRVDDADEAIIRTAINNLVTDTSL